MVEFNTNRQKDDPSKLEKNVNIKIRGSEQITGFDIDKMDEKKPQEEPPKTKKMVCLSSTLHAKKNLKYLESEESAALPLLPHRQKDDPKLESTKSLKPKDTEQATLSFLRRPQTAAKDFQHLERDEAASVSEEIEHHSANAISEEINDDQSGVRRVKIGIRCPKENLYYRDKADDRSVILPEERFNLKFLPEIREKWDARITTSINFRDEVTFNISAYETIKSPSPTESIAYNLKKICRKCEGDGIFSLKLWVKRNRCSFLDDERWVFQTLLWGPIAVTTEPEGHRIIETRGSKFHVNCTFDHIVSLIRDSFFD